VLTLLFCWSNCLVRLPIYFSSFLALVSNISICFSNSFTFVFSVSELLILLYTVFSTSGYFLLKSSFLTVSLFSIVFYFLVIFFIFFIYLLLLLLLFFFY